MAEPKNHLMHYRDGKRMALCGRMAYGSWFDEPERWGRLPSSEQCGHCRAALRRMGGVDGYMREALACIIQCAVTRCHSSAGANPARQLSLQPVAVGADDGGNDIG